MYNLRNKRNQGITLIALVITIIVLLILAAISITMLTGDNSLLNRAGEAKNRTELSSLKEEAQMVMLNRVTEKKTSGSNEKTLKEDLENGISNAIVESINTTEESEGLTDVYYVSKNGQYVTVYEDGDIEEGKVEIWDGKKVSSPEFKKENNVWNWYIYTPSQLKFLADFVNNGNKFDGRDDLKKLVEDAKYDTSTVTMTTDTTIYLMNNLDLGSRQIDGQLTSGTSWTPIGMDFNNISGKLGTFEGNDYCIRGVYVKTNTNFNGIFGNSNTIQRLTIKDSYIEGATYTGGITGALFSGKIEKCNNKNTIIKSSSKCVGGIAGFSQGTISYCSNNGSIEASGTGDAQVGGIVGYEWTDNSDMSINNCVNNGIVKGKGSNVGGIIGFVTTTQNDLEIINCTNSGMIIGEADSVGGIVGNSINIKNVSNCNNSGNVIGGDYVGGITGITTRASNCNNKGTIIGKRYVGGITGYVNYITNCNNSGTITGKNDVDGIAGYIANSATNCKDNGKVNIVNE